MGNSSIYFQFKTLPIEPGVYQFFDKEDTVIYIGKAKNLKRRVTSYFTKVHENAKTRVLVKKIDRMEHIVVPSEVDALLLENNLIKKYRPRYNILLKDDKTYPWICIKREPFPRIFSTRKVIRDGSEYYGPYPNVKTLYTLIEHIKDPSLVSISSDETYPLTYEPSIDFPSIKFARDALTSGGLMPTVLNAANEIAVEKFINNEIKFDLIFDTIKHVMEKFD